MPKRCQPFVSQCLLGELDIKGAAAIVDVAALKLGARIDGTLLQSKLQQSL
jgi:hypothetical protein